MCLLGLHDMMGAHSLPMQHGNRVFVMSTALGEVLIGVEGHIAQGVLRTHSGIAGDFSHLTMYTEYKFNACHISTTLMKSLVCSHPTSTSRPSVPFLHLRTSSLDPHSPYQTTNFLLPASVSPPNDPRPQYPSALPLRHAHGPTDNARSADAQVQSCPQHIHVHARACFVGG
jgi:hypothetical protein